MSVIDFRVLWNATRIWKAFFALTASVSDSPASGAGTGISKQIKAKSKHKKPHSWERGVERGRRGKEPEEGDDQGAGSIVHFTG
eukprot:1993430-Rhodomonas_salina.2